MGFRFRKTVTIFPFVHLNFSKSGVSLSLGKRGLMYNVGSQRETIAIGAPGTGVGYRASFTFGLLLILIGLVALIAIAWHFYPETVRWVLHQWQPSWF
jgi:hypothetical protein